MRILRPYGGHPTRATRAGIGLWLSLLAVCAQLLSPLGHASMIGETTAGGTGGLLCVGKQGSAAANTLALPAELQQALLKLPDKHGAPCADCLSSGSAPLVPLAATATAGVDAAGLLLPQLRAVVPRLSLYTPPATGPPLRF